MRRLKVKDPEACMACLQCVTACAATFYKTDDITKACIKFEEKNRVVIPRTCIQCGKCARNCEAGAITQNPKGFYFINKKLCVRCGKCVEVCPFGLIVWASPDVPPSKCIACGICAKPCPMESLEVVET